MRIALVVAGAALAALACSPALQGVPTSSQPEEPRTGGHVSLRVPIDPFDWDLSYVGKSSPNGYGQAMAYDSLLGYKASPDIKYQEMILEPHLAGRWEVSPDARTYTFHLRKGVKFADLPPVNGRELTSNDVKWSFEYWSRLGQFKEKKLPQGQFDSMFEGMESIETPDPYTAVVKFKDPFVPFLSYAASDYNPIVPHDIYDADGHLQERIAGTGAFQLAPGASQAGSRWVWKKNTNYWQPGRPYLDEVRWLVVADDAAAVAAFQAKQIDHLTTNGLTHRTVDDLSKLPSVVIYPYQQEVGWHIYLQVQKPPFNDVRVRRALAMSIDRDELSMALNNVKSPWAPAGALLGLFSEEEARQMLRYDPQEAKRLLAEAGYPSGLDVVWEFPGKAYGDLYISSLELMQAQTRKAGFNIALKSLDKDSFSSKRKAKDFSIHMVSSSCAGLSEEYETLLYTCFKSGNKSNYADVQDPELDRLLLASRGEVNTEKRRELLRSSSRLMNEKAYAINLVYAPRWETWQSSLNGYVPHLGSKGQNMVNAWVAR